MITSLVFGCGLAATIRVALGVVGYLNGPLRKQLLELCGTAERVAFWAAFAQASPRQGTAQNFRYSTRWVIFFSGRRPRRACFAKAMRSMDGSILGNPTSHILDPMLSINSGHLWAVIKYFHESCVSSNNPGLHCRIFC